MAARPRAHRCIPVETRDNHCNRTQLCVVCGRRGAGEGVIQAHMVTMTRAECGGIFVSWYATSKGR